MSSPAAPTSRSAKTFKGKTPATKPKLNKDEALAAMHVCIVRREFSLRHVATRVQYDKVVGIKPADVRTFKFGTVRNTNTSQSATVEQALWERVRYGPTALENKAVRRAVEGGNFSLRHVETEVSYSPVVLPLQVPTTTTDREMLSGILRFDKEKLAHVEPNTSHKIVVTDALYQQMKNDISRFPSIQLNHVEPKVSYRPIKGDCEKMERPILQAICRFDRTALKKTTTHVKTSPAVVVKPKELAEKTAKPSLDMKAVISNVETLVQLGFQEKKKSFALLIKNGNDLVKVIELLLAH